MTIQERNQRERKIKCFLYQNREAIFRAFLRTYGYMATEIAHEAFGRVLFDYDFDLTVQEL